MISLLKLTFLKIPCYYKGYSNLIWTYVSPTMEKAKFVAGLQWGVLSSEGEDASWAEYAGTGHKVFQKQSERMALWKSRWSLKSRASGLHWWGGMDEFSNDVWTSLKSESHRTSYKVSLKMGISAEVCDAMLKKQDSVIHSCRQFSSFVSFFTFFFLHFLLPSFLPSLSPFFLFLYCSFFLSIFLSFFSFSLSFVFIV